MPPITIYTTPTCPFCIAAKRLLTSRGLSFDEISVAGDSVKRNEMREKAGGQNTVPQIWIGETHVGGSDDLYALEASGELEQILE